MVFGVTASKLLRSPRLLLGHSVSIRAPQFVAQDLTIYLPRGGTARAAHPQPSKLITRAIMADSVFALHRARRMEVRFAISGLAVLAVIHLYRSPDHG